MINYEYIRNMETEYHSKYPNSILLVLSGNFYNAYGKDAYILCYLFKFKCIHKVYITQDEKEVSIPKTGFPRNSLDKVLLDLEDKKVNYVIKIKDKNDIFQNFKKLNTYEKRYTASEKYCIDKLKLNEIMEQCEALCGKKEFSNVLAYIQKYIGQGC